MPVEIADWNDLDNVRNDLTGDYVLVNDLDSGTNGYAGIGDDFEPIGFVSGTRRGDPFSGVLDGDGFQISDLVIEENDSAEGGVAFITQVGNGGLVENLSVAGSVNSTISDFFYGGLSASVGKDGAGAIQNCVSHVDVTGGGDRLGGLVGDSEGEITDSYATGSVDGSGDDVGGLVGNNSGTITDSYATGSVEGDNSVGGLVGDNSGTITDLYATGSVEAVTSGAGGLVGRNQDTIETSYAVGFVTGGSEVGGLVGDEGFTNEVIDSYWDTETTGQSTSEGGTGLTTDEMQGSEAETNMDGFEFEGAWSLVVENENSDGDGYPILRAIDFETQGDEQSLNITGYFPELFELSVETNPATDISAFSATLNGELVELDEEADDADVFFEFGENVTDAQTTIQTLTGPATFDELVDELTNDTTFEFRAVAEAQDADNETFTDEGDILTFTTENTQIDVQTNAADENAFFVTANGEVVDIGAYDSADTFFEFGFGAVDDESTDVVTVESATALAEELGPFESGSDTAEFRAVAIGENDGIRYEGDTLTFTTDTATIEGVINRDDPIEGAVVKAENKSTGESYGRDETDAQGQYAFENISGLEIGQMLELLVDAKRPDEDENLSTVLAPTVGEPGN